MNKDMIRTKCGLYRDMVRAEAKFIDAKDKYFEFSKANKA